MSTVCEIHPARAAIELLEKLQNFLDLNCDLQRHQIGIQLIIACGKCCKRICTKHAALIYEQKQQLRTERPGLAGSCRHYSNHSSVASSGPDQWCVFCTPSLAVFRTCCNQMVSNLANLEATV